MKGILFALLVLLGSALILGEAPSWRVLLALLVVIWASARFYYFLFYVLENYVDPTLRYSGICALLKQLRIQKKPRP